MYVVLFVSRNKDNAEVKGFKQRKKTFFTDNPENLDDAFDEFVHEGVKGEFSRYYVSASERNMEQTRKMLACRLVMDDKVDLSKLEPLAVSLAMQPENELQKKWLFDFDCPVFEEIWAFSEELEALVDGKEYTPGEDGDPDFVNSGSVTPMYTPHGFAVVAEHGFNNKDFLPRWNERLMKLNPNYSVTLKRNAMVLKHWQTNY